jgi:hypothetical protein
MLVLSNISRFTRLFKSHLFFKMIQVVSLTIGFAVFLVLFSLATKDLGYDKFWNTEDKLYRVSMEVYQEGELNFRSAKSYRGLPGLMVEEFPEVTGKIRLSMVLTAVRPISVQGWR